MNIFTTNKKFRRIGATLTIMLLIILSFTVRPTVSVKAFKPTSGMRANQADLTHKDITSFAITEVLRDPSFISPAPISGSTSSEIQTAINEINRGNIRVDLSSELIEAPAHFDNEEFEAGQARLVGRRESPGGLLGGIINDLQNDESAEARSKLGQALHTIQDFYSHSNWVELGHLAPSTDLGRPGSSHRMNLIRDQAGTSDRTCVACDGTIGTGVDCVDCMNNLLRIPKLTSGYFGLPVGEFVRNNRCGHGGSGDLSGTPRGGINKDSSCDASPHGYLHIAAASFAVVASEQFIRDLKNHLTVGQLKCLFNIRDTLAIAIDTTGSMQPIIDSVKQQAIQIVTSRLDTPEEPCTYILAPFNDPEVPEPLVTTNPNEFIAAIDSLSASGGGDCPELSQTAMFKAISKAPGKGELFLFTDANAKDGAMATSIRNLAQQKEIKVFESIFGNCGGSSVLTDQSSKFQFSNSKILSVSAVNVDPSYLLVAEGTGGQVFALSAAEAGSITRLADFLVRSNSVDVLSISDTLVGVAKNYSVPVDSTMTRATFSVSGTSNVVVRRPNGTPIQLGDPGVDAILLNNVAIYSVTSPTTGSWSVTVNGAGAFSLSVSGESNLFLSSFDFVEVEGRSGHAGLFEIAGFPLAGQTGTADAEMSTGFATAQFELRSKTDAVLQPLNLTRDSGTAPNRFFGDVSLPNISFLIYVTGQDVNGMPYQRLLPGITKTQTVQVIAPPTQNLRPGQITSYIFQVKNLGAPDNFRLLATDDKSFIRNASPATFTLGTNQSVNVTVQLQPPPSTPFGTTETLTVTAQITSKDVNNFAVVTSQVTDLGFDMCIQDDSNGSLLRFNSTTGEYEFRQCRKGITLTGRGAVTVRVPPDFCKVSLQDSGIDPKRPDRNVSVWVNPCTNQAIGSVQVLPSGQKFVLTDTNINNNSCGCP